MRQPSALLLVATVVLFVGCASTSEPPPSAPSATPSDAASGSSTPELTGSDLELAIIDALVEARPGYYGAAHQIDGTVEVTVFEPHDDLTDADLEELRTIAQRLAGDRTVTIRREGPPPSEDAAP